MAWRVAIGAKRVAQVGLRVAVALVVLYVLYVVGAFVLFALNPEWRTDEPPWGQRDTVAVEPPPSEPAVGGSEPPDSETSTKIDRSDPATVLRDYYEKRLDGWEDYEIIASPTAVECGKVELRAGGGTVSCVVEHHDARVDHTITLEDLRVPPPGTGGLMTWHDSFSFDEVIVTQDVLNRAFWRHLGETGVRDEDQEIRCDRVPEPVAQRIDRLHQHRCYRAPSGGGPRIYFLAHPGRFTFEPWSGITPRDAEDWQPEE